MKDLTIIIKTLLRPAELEACIESIHKTCGTDIKIYVADDSPPKTINPRTDIDEYFILPYDSGASYGRNYMVDRVKTKYLMVIDDDTVFLPTTKKHIDNALSILENHGNIDLVGGREEGVAWYGSMKIENNILMLDLGSSTKAIDGYPLYDFVPQIYIARTDKIASIQWDNELKTAEHEDFFWRAKGKLNCIFLPHFIVINSHALNKEYIKHRNRQYYTNLWHEKIGVKETHMRVNNKPLSLSEIWALSQNGIL